MSKVQLRSVFRDTAPVVAGYLVLGMGFGILMRGSGYGIWYALAMSLFVYAGSMQYAAIGLFTGGASMLTVALTTLAVNARHLFYGISMVEPYKNAGKKKPYLIFGLSDETYSLVCGGNRSVDECFFVTLFDQIYWLIGTALGSLLGSVLPFDSKGIDFSLTALFITVFLDQWLNNRNHFPALIGLGGSVVCLLIFGKNEFLIPSMLVIAVVLLLGWKKGGERQ